MNLGYDDRSSSRRSKGSAIGHERNIAHVYIFLTDFARRWKIRFMRFQWNRIG